MIRIMRSVENGGRRSVRMMCAIGVGALVLSASACSSSSTASSSAKPSAHYRSHGSSLTFNTPAEQVAAEQSTSSYRTAMTRAGLDLSTSLTAARDQMDAGQPDRAIGSLRQALLAFDPVRGMLAPGTGSVPQISLGTPGATLDPAGIAHVIGLITSADPSARPALEALVGQAASVRYLLAHKVLLPQQIAFATQGLLGWIALVSPSAFGTDPTEGATPADVASAATAARQQVASLEPLGAIVAPSATADAVSLTDRLVADLGTTETPDPRRVIFTADAALASIGRLIPALAGFGVHIQGYQ